MPPTAHDVDTALDSVRRALADLAAMIEREGARATAKAIADTGIRCEPRDHCDPRTCVVARYLTAMTGYPVSIAAICGCNVYRDADALDRLDRLGVVDTPESVAELFRRFDDGQFDDLLMAGR